MSYLVPLQAAAGFVTGTLLTTGVMLVGAKSAKKLSDSNSSVVVGTITGMTLLMGVVENSRAMSPFYKGMQTAVKVVVIYCSTIIGIVCSKELTEQSSYRPPHIATGISIGIGIIVSIFLSVMSLSIHPIITPVVASTISCVLICTVNTVVNNM